MSTEAIIVLVVIVVLVVGTTLVSKRRGYKMGGGTVVRCRKGHLFTTIWVPRVSPKAVRLGWVRLQRCPVGNHWSLVTRFHTQQSTVVVDSCRHMNISMGVDTTSDTYD